MKTIKKSNKKESIIDALTNAQKLAFAPLAFQALNSLIELGILEKLDENRLTEKEIMAQLNLDEYTVRTLLHIGKLNNIISQENDVYKLTKTGKMFLYNDMTKANFKFVRDVCYLGASELTSSLKEQKPKGLQKFIGDYETIYPALTILPEHIKESWYEFDHLYSDNCFDEVFKIITKKYNSIFDIGGNTGKFEKVCLKYDKNVDATMLDLKENIDSIKNNKELTGCKFLPINVLDEKPTYPIITNSAVFMSQFLDCFSKKDILKILTDIKEIIDNSSSIFILEPYTDEQKFFGAEYSLAHTSLYFTCMANGVSKMYTLKEMKEIIEASGLTIKNCIKNIGNFDYTLLECVKNEVV